MEKKCYTCKHEGRGIYSTPCWDCTRYNTDEWEPKEITRDEKQCWLELLAMYLKALGDCEGIDEMMYEVKKDMFMNKLSEFKTAIILEYEEGKK